MRLSRAAWIDAGYAALAEGGMRAVAVEPLAKRLKATKGSFYWHFADREELVKAVLERWEELETTRIVQALDAVPDPTRRLEALGRGAYARANRAGAHAAVLAHADDPVVAPILARVTRTRLQVLERLFAAMGLDTPQARRRARLAYSVYLGTASLRRSQPDEELTDDEVEAQVALMVSAVVPDGAKDA